LKCAQCGAAWQVLTSGDGLLLDSAATLLAFGAGIVATIATAAFATISPAATATTSATTAATTFAVFALAATASAVVAFAAFRRRRRTGFFARIPGLIRLAVTRTAIVALEPATTASAAMATPLTVAIEVAVAITMLVAFGTVGRGCFRGSAAEEVFQPAKEAAGFFRFSDGSRARAPGGKGRLPAAGR
jgi:hypothetical protein